MSRALCEGMCAANQQVQALQEVQSRELLKVQAPAFSRVYFSVPSGWADLPIAGLTPESASGTVFGLSAAAKGREAFS